ncbi:MAG: hypothetical protein OQK67_06880 [Chlorobium sp.]|nr:hypothetical protein [Chlorobium sp.]
MPGSLTSWGQSCARVIALRLYCLLPLGGHGLPKFAHFAAQWLAYMHPCQRFTLILAVMRA